MNAAHVGIFWFVPEAAGTSVLLCDLTPLESASHYGDMLTHDGGHATHWDHLADLGTAGLRALGKPTAPAESEYDDWPRGRVVFDSRRHLFVIYADSHIQADPYIIVVRQTFGLLSSATVTASDDHYARSRPVGLPKRSSYG